MSWETSSAYPNYPGNNGKVVYKEGIFVGYRYYDSNNTHVLFPFGHGLSYTTFEYKNIQVNPAKVSEHNTPVRVQLEIMNTGKYKGTEVVQLYIHDRKTHIKRPYKELKGFDRITLKPGERRQIVMQLDRRAFACYSVELKEWIVEPGIFDILVGGSSKDIRLIGSVIYE